MIKDNFPTLLSWTHSHFHGQHNPRPYITVNTLLSGQSGHKKNVTLSRDSEFILIPELIQTEEKYLFKYDNFCNFQYFIKNKPRLIIKYICKTNFTEVDGPPLPSHSIYMLMAGPALSVKEVKLFCNTT